MSIWTRIADVIASIGESVGGFLQAVVVAQSDAAREIRGLHHRHDRARRQDGEGRWRGDARDEITAFKQVFHIPDGELAAVARVFNLAKQDTAGFETYARQIAKLFEAQHEVLEDVLDGLFHIAKADNAFHPGEHGFLRQVAEIFGFTRGRLRPHPRAPRRRCRMTPT